MKHKKILRAIDILIDELVDTQDETHKPFHEYLISMSVYLMNERPQPEVIIHEPRQDPVPALLDAVVPREYNPENVPEKLRKLAEGGSERSQCGGCHNPLRRDETGNCELCGWPAID